MAHTMLLLIRPRKSASGLNEVPESAGRLSSGFAGEAKLGSVLAGEAMLEHQIRQTDQPTLGFC